MMNARCLYWCGLLAAASTGLMNAQTQELPPASSQQSTPPRYSNVIGHAMNDSGMIVVSAEDSLNPTPPVVNPDGTTTNKDSLMLLIPVGIAVDANRDGEVTFYEKDKTTAAKPYRFWINNDKDDVEVDEPVDVNANEGGFS